MSEPRDKQHECAFCRRYDRLLRERIKAENAYRFDFAAKIVAGFLACMLFAVFVLGVLAAAYKMYRVVKQVSTDAAHANFNAKQAVEQIEPAVLYQHDKSNLPVVCPYTGQIRR